MQLSHDDIASTFSVRKQHINCLWQKLGCKQNIWCDCAVSLWTQDAFRKMPLV